MAPVWIEVANQERGAGHPSCRTWLYAPGSRRFRDLRQIFSFLREGSVNDFTNKYAVFAHGQRLSGNGQQRPMTRLVRGAIRYTERVDLR